jgi:hypothetical protein
MPIRTTTVDRQRTLASLAKALFDTGNRPEAVGRAVEALRHANPQLAENAALKSGMTLFVPKIANMKLAAGKTRAADDVVVNLALERARSLAQLAGKPLDATIAAAEERARDAQSPDTVRMILRARPDLKEGIKFMQEGAAREVERVKAAATTFRAIIDAVVQDLQKRSSR